MTTQEAVAILREHNRWRRNGDIGDVIDPKRIGEAIDHVCDVLDSIQRAALMTSGGFLIKSNDWLDLLHADRRDRPNA